jgi:hypothetical protein
MTRRQDLGLVAPDGCRERTVLAKVAEVVEV